MVKKIVMEIFFMEQKTQLKLTHTSSDKLRNTGYIHQIIVNNIIDSLTSFPSSHVCLSTYLLMLFPILLPEI